MLLFYMFCISAVGWMVKLHHRRFVVNVTNKFLWHWTHQQTRLSAALLAVCTDEVVSKMADFLLSRSVLSVCFPNCLLTSGEVEQLRKSKEIDKCINRDKTYVKRLVKILLLGAGESGKSTFLKQMRIIHGQDFDQKAKEDFRATIFSNVIKGKMALST